MVEDKTPLEKRHNYEFKYNEIVCTKCGKRHVGYGIIVFALTDNEICPKADQP